MYYPISPNTSQVKFKKTEVEDHHRISSISNQSKSVNACNNSLKSRTSNVNDVCATCGKCMFNSNHDACVSKYLNDVNASAKKPKVVPISTRKPKSQAKKSIATPHKKTVASESTTKKSKSYYRMLYEKTSKAWKWWIEQQCPSGYKWAPKTKTKWVPKVRNENVQKRVSFAIDNASRITNVLKLTNTGYDLLTGNRGSDLYTISLQETTLSTPICLMAKASLTQAWLWHRILYHLNFDYINLLSKKDVVIGLPKLKYVKDQLCSSCEDETPYVLKDFITMIQRNLQALVISVRTDRGTEFLNKTLNAFFKQEGIEHQTSTPRTPEQNGVVRKIETALLLRPARTNAYQLLNFMYSFS
ncbi:retrovirus-related pol polyprotein from transposon TNT 1-94 [Tanacetum coccineum]